MATLAPPTLRITDDRQSKADAPIVRSQDFQLLVEEARATLDVVTSIYFLLILFNALMFMIIIYMMLYRDVPSERCSNFSSVWFGHCLIVCISCA